MRNWLQSDREQSNGGAYHHTILAEQPGDEDRGRALFKAYIVEAHQDAKRRLRAVLEHSLDPLGAPAEFDPADGYPWQLERITLTGYMGEVMTAMVAENFAPGGCDGWCVPVHLFRFHDIAFQELARIRQVGGRRRRIPGRTGDDCLAFILDNQGHITRYLVAEAKCSLDHSADLVNAAHRTFDDRVVIPVSLSQAIEALKAVPSPESERWQRALLELATTKCAKASRLNLIGYVCGRLPSRQKSWMPRTWKPGARPHNMYRSRIDLEAVEVHLPSVEVLIRECYEDRTVWSG